MLPSNYCPIHHSSLQILRIQVFHWPVASLGAHLGQVARLFQMVPTPYFEIISSLPSGMRREDPRLSTIMTFNILLSTPTGKAALANASWKIGCWPSLHELASLVSDIICVLRCERNCRNIEDRRRPLALVHGFYGVNHVSMPPSLISRLDSRHTDHRPFQFKMRMSFIIVLLASGQGGIGEP